MPRQNTSPLRFTRSSTLSTFPCWTSQSPPSVSKLIKRVSWTDNQLLCHLKYFDFTGGAAIGLADVIKRQAEIDENADFEAFAAYESQGYVSSTFELYDVGKEGIPRPVVWNALKGIHADGQAVGLVTILHEPSTLMLGACT
ncbi:GTPase-activator protein for ras-like gtpase containing protein [Colletotrichum tofieldiae]|nr:GTPase-activator protein for ras-like gtpase containing protein [Colletotrichum tofieldiae]